MNHMIDDCEFCGTFQRVTIERVEEDGDARVVCSSCLKMFWDYEDDEKEPSTPVNYKKYKWKEISSV